MRGRDLGRGFLITLAVFCFASVSWGQGADKTERVLFNAKVFTGVPDHPYAEAVAIRGDRIMAVGSLAEVSAIDPSATRVDLQGKFLLPGLIDSHAHPVEGGIALISADVANEMPSMDALVGFAADAKKSGKGMRGDVLRISGMPLVYWSKTDELNARLSSGAYADVPVFLSGMDGHTGWANRTLLRRRWNHQGFPQSSFPCGAGLLRDRPHRRFEWFCRRCRSGQDRGRDPAADQGAVSRGRTSRHPLSAQLGNHRLARRRG